MHLKKLTLCLLGLSLSACSTHVIKSNALNADQDAPQRAIQGFNALYEYPNFDYRGQFQVHLDRPQKDQNLKSTDSKQLDPAIEKKVNQYLKDQKIKLTDIQKKELYQAIAKQDSNYISRFVGMGADVVQNIVNDLQIRYDGTVNYRQKMASFNLETQYKKPNLSVEMRIPTVLDMNNYKFYTHIFSIMPYLANSQDQDKYAYYDFSKYKDDINKVNGKALIELLKQSGATSYLIAAPHQIQNLAVSSADKQAGIVEKIRLNTSVEEMFLQGQLYSTVNRQYLMNSVFGLNQSNIAKILGPSSDSQASDAAYEAAQEAMKAADEALAGITSSDDSANDASSAMYELYNAVNRKSHEDLEEEVEAGDAAQARAAVEDDEDDATADQDQERDSDDEAVEAAADGNTTKILTEQQCEDLTKAKVNPRFGDVEYCQYHYEIDVLKGEQQKESSSDTALREKNKTALVSTFNGYAKDQLVDAQQFKQLWNQHLTEIESSLPAPDKRNPLIVDLSLDNKGRAVKADYDMGLDLDTLNRKLNIKMDMQFLNYGNASKIDQNVLKQAKPFKEIFKGSIMEQAVGGISGSERSDEQKYLSLDERLEQLAEQVFAQTGSYEKTYKAVFIAKLTAQKPELIKQYSAQDLQEIAAIYAYSYSDEAIYNPKGQALKQIQALQKKHHLEDDHQYDDELGNDVDEIVAKIWKAKQSTLEVQSLVKKYKTTEAVFAQYYMQKFEAENEIEKSQRGEFIKTAKVLAKSYVAFKNNKFNDQVVSTLNVDSNEFIDYDLFKQAYQALSDAKLK
ncbi:MAG: hypothetical protein VX125_09470 [Pseudomonadota bacterium]|uniref:Uncharacterized protein n=1 Tax=Acinetobacter bereziniae TaxID=106648 RepID=A0A8I1AJC7_ACIBZ|nr:MULTISPECIES: hypothetical protein [Acinetobacter]MEC8124061.1 hypothetical protein [Pseudomonadota bacterium]MBJ9950350.1 hypothetical protein [Acinetobacter bereziniae]QQC84312.1 hypothetical protein I9190_19110 [Acinetobacter bereziniae]UUN97501.1 hypothetical protein I9054_019575 [Acinetobacter bereziniae]BCX75616.1 hypothetical protein TOL5_38160 [Acinetobacter sp. Tol 5]